MTSHDNEPPAALSYDYCDVLIVGAGPVGQVTALPLARQDVTVTILERLSIPTRCHRQSCWPTTSCACYTPPEWEKEHDFTETLGHNGDLGVFEDAAGQVLLATEYPLQFQSGFATMCSFFPTREQEDKCRHR